MLLRYYASYPQNKNNYFLDEILKNKTKIYHHYLSYFVDVACTIVIFYRVDYVKLLIIDL